MLVGGETWWWHLWKFPLGGFFSPPPPPADKEARSSAVNGGGRERMTSFARQVREETGTGPQLSPMSRT